MDKQDWNRLALISALAERMKERKNDFGRTALMKFAYLLQTIKNVPLDYNFTLYSYGPFDSAVLSDLAYAVSLEAVDEKTVIYPSSYGYKIQPGPDADCIKQKASLFLDTYAPQIDWVVDEFGDNGAGELELISTILYADREAAQNGAKSSIEEIASLVNKIKPHFSVPQVEYKARDLQSRGFLSGPRNRQIH
jgi:uncharacterized protein